MKAIRLALIFMLMLSATALGQESSSQITGRPDNHYDAGNQIDIKTPVAGDLVLAGRVLNIDSQVSGDVIAAGWRVSLLKAADDDVRLAGSTITVDAPIKGDLTAAGGEVTIGPHAHVNGRAWLAGSQIRLGGTFDRELQVAGAHVTITGELRQPVRIITEQLEILPGAKVTGPLTYESPKPARIADGAIVTGSVTHRMIDPRAAREARWPSRLATFLFIVHLSIAGTLLFVMFPRVATHGVDTLKAQPWRSLMVGLLLTVLVPFAGVMLLVTVIGAPLALVLGAAFMVSLLVGIVTTAAYIGEMEVRWLKAGAVAPTLQNFRSVVLGVLTLALLRSVFGGWIAAPAIAFGMGAYGLWTYRHYRQPGSVASV